MTIPERFVRRSNRQGVGTGILNTDAAEETRFAKEALMRRRLRENAHDGCATSNITAR
jgi:hypothetical protein